MSAISGPQGQNLVNNGGPVPPGSKPKIKTLTNLMIANIIILVVVGFASILIMLFGEFDGKGIRVTTTFLVFAAFTTFTALDSNSKHPDWHLPIGQVGNVYMLALSLIQIWASLGGRARDTIGYDGFGIFANVVMIIIVVKIGTIIVQKIADFIFVDRQYLPLASKVSAGSFALATILYTLPLGMGWVEFFKEENYGRFSAAVILLGGLSLAITVLLAWFYGLLTKSLHEPVSLRTQPQTQKNPSADFGSHPQHQNAPQQGHVPAPQSGGPHRVVDANVPLDKPTIPVGQELPASIPIFAPPVASTLSWPVFPNGLPLPARSNGRPDFGALREVSRLYDEAEKQHFA